MKAKQSAGFLFLKREAVSYKNKQYSLWLLLACGKAVYCCARDYSSASSSGLGTMGVPYNG